MTLFFDNFDSGTLANWPTQIGTVSASAAAAYGGSAFGGRVSPGGGSAGQIATSTTKWAQNTFTWTFIHVKFRFNSLPVGTTADTFTLQTALQLDNFDFYYNNTTGTFWFDLKGANFIDLGKAPIIGHWYDFQAKVFFGATTYTGQVQLDGVQSAVLNSFGETSSFVRSFHIGTSSTTKTFQLDVDDVYIDVGTTEPNFEVFTPMTFSHSKDSRLFFNTEHISGTVSGFTTQAERNLSGVTSILDTGNRFIPGLNEGALQIEGTFDSTPGVTITTHEVLRDSIGVDNAALTTACPSGLTIGFPAFVGRGDASSYEVESAVADAVKYTFQSTGDNGVDWGVILHAHNAVTATGQDASSDGLAATTGGGVALLHVTAASGTTPSATIKVQHSTDNSTWVDLITFTAATVKTSEYKTVSGTVNRYLRAQYTISGTGPSFTFLLSFARR